MSNAITCYIVRDDLLILVPDTDEMHDRIMRYIGPPPDGVRWIILAPGSTVTDLRNATWSEPDDSDIPILTPWVDEGSGQ